MLHTQNSEESISEKRRLRGLTSDTAEVQRAEQSLFRGERLFLSRAEREILVRRGSQERYGGGKTERKLECATRERGGDRDRVIFHHSVDGTERREALKGQEGASVQKLKRESQHWVGEAGLLC